ncbi:MAG: radical SAM protein [Clostridia bacterium]|nr:radical SAM protein [Clostridia bacterium]
MKNVYFIQANNVYGTDKKSAYIPYAAGCIQAYCQKSETISAEYNFGRIIYKRENAQAVISQLDNPYMVLFSCSVWNKEYNKVAAEAIKKAFPDCYITFGGHSVSSDGKDLEECGYVDFITHRFGEEPTEGLLESLATGKPLSEVANISFRNENGEIITTAFEPQTGTDYPSPYLEGVFDDIMDDGISFSVLLETNRGCPNSCSFCDWGSLKSKVRLFPLERVFAEIDWFVEHKIEFIFCADGNFCLFNRDADIANYIVSCKEKYGYPKVFRVCFTKNRFDFVFDIGTKFFRKGLNKAQTISFQSLDEQVLANVGRKNIPIEFFKDLMKKYQEMNIATFSELILGLPGETYESFCKGVSILIENGQHFAMSIYPCDLLPNSLMGQKEYKEKFAIESTKVPFRLIHSNSFYDNEEITEYNEVVTSTYSMSREEWVKALIFSYYIQGLHNLGLLRCVAVYCCNEYAVSYGDFYNMLLEYSRKNKNTLLNRVFTKTEKLCTGVAESKNEFVTEYEGTEGTLWGFDEVLYLDFYKELDLFYNETKAFVEENFGTNEIIGPLFRYQHDTVKKINLPVVEITSDYDFYSYFNAVYSNSYMPLEKKSTALKIRDDAPVSSFFEFAREVVWYGRNTRASDYTSTNYDIEILT